MTEDLTWDARYAEEPERETLTGTRLPEPVASELGHADPAWASSGG